MTEQIKRKQTNKIIRVEIKEDMEWKELKYLCNHLSKIKGYNFEIHHSFNNTLVRSKGLEKKDEIVCAPNPTKLQDDNLPNEISVVENEIEA